MAKILIVDDSDITIAELQSVLELDGHEVIKAHDGRSGIKAFHENQDVSVIFTDINMPIMNGVQMCQELCKLYEKVPPILVISTEVSQKVKMEAKKSGVVAWMMKPFNPETLPKITKQFIDKYSPKK